MAFKRMEGFAGSIPQKFIDRKMPVCPMCGTNAPHWALDMKMQMKLEGNRYLFRCEKCGCILSSPVADVTGESHTPFTTMGLFKMADGKENDITYMRVEDAGATGFVKYVGREFPLQALNELAAARAQINRQK